jgi:hypothetical protein
LPDPRLAERHKPTKDSEYVIVRTQISCVQIPHQLGQTLIKYLSEASSCTLPDADFSSGPHVMVVI